MHLGATLCQPHICICGKEVESDGCHGLNCDKQIGRFPRHAEANSLIKRALSQIDCPSILEPKNLLDSQGLIPAGNSIPLQTGQMSHIGLHLYQYYQ